MSEPRFTFDQFDHEDQHTNGTALHAVGFDRYLDHPTSEFATTKKEIEENYYFFGTLLKNESGRLIRKESITQNNATCLTEVHQRFGPGNYELRTETAENPIKFFIPESMQADKPQATRNERERTEADIRREITAEVEEHYDKMIALLNKRLTIQEDELESKSRKIRELNEEIGEIQRRSQEQSTAKVERLEQKIEEQYREIRKLERESLENKFELQYGTEPQSGVEMFLDAVSSPSVQSIVEGIFSQMGQKSAPQLAAAAERPNPSPENENEEHQNQQPMTERDLKAALMKNMASLVIEGLQQKNPDVATIEKIALDQIRQVESQTKIEAQVWGGIAKAILHYADKNNVPGAKVGKVMYPVINQMAGDYKEDLKSMPVSVSTNMLIKLSKIADVEPEEKELLKSVLKYFKQNA